MESWAFGALEGCDVGLDRKQNQDPVGTRTPEKVGNPTKKDSRGSGSKTVKENTWLSSRPEARLSLLPSKTPTVQ